MAYYVSIKEELRAQGWVNEVHKRAELTPHGQREYRLVPTHRLVARLGLTEWEQQACSLDERGYHPAWVSIPLQQHIGAPACPVVSVGTRVAVGDLIAEIPEGKMGALIHASIAGRVSRISEDAIRIEA
jgi:Na+-translocating ferredoxin:NAD+ oxidoreductase RnfC subunit